MSEALIARLAADLRPAPRRAVVRRMALGLSMGAAVSAVFVASTLGLQPNLLEVAVEGMFWVKLAYALALSGVALRACERLARPAGIAGDRMAWLFAPCVAVAVLAFWQLAGAPASMRGAMTMGHTAGVCPWYILAFSLPPLLGLVWAVRGLAPTRLRLTGAVLGLAAGGTGAAVYALHCDEATAPFLAVWYTLGMSGAVLIGALAGPRVLRW